MRIPLLRRPPPTGKLQGLTVRITFATPITEVSDLYTNLAGVLRTSSRQNRGQGGVAAHNATFVEKTTAPVQKVTALASAVDIPPNLEENSMAPPVKVSLLSALGCFC